MTDIEKAHQEVETALIHSKALNDMLNWLYYEKNKHPKTIMELQTTIAIILRETNEQYKAICERGIL